MLRNGCWIWAWDLEVNGDLDENIFRGILRTRFNRSGFKREWRRANVDNFPEELCFKGAGHGRSSGVKGGIFIS